MRRSWDDPNALFIGIQSGSHHVDHGHLNTGNFELDALGVRWARDLGANYYGLPGYWAGQEGGRRWTHFRLNSTSHNLVTFDGQDYELGAYGKILTCDHSSFRPRSCSISMALGQAGQNASGEASRWWRQGPPSWCRMRSSCRDRAKSLGA